MTDREAADIGRDVRLSGVNAIDRHQREPVAVIEVSVERRIAERNDDSAVDVVRIAADLATDDQRLSERRNEIRIARSDDVGDLAIASVTVGTQCIGAADVVTEVAELRLLGRMPADSLAFWDCRSGDRFASGDRTSSHPPSRYRPRRSARTEDRARYDALNRQSVEHELSFRGLCGRRGPRKCRALQASEQARGHAYPMRPR